MNEIIRSIESAQLRTDIPEFRVGDTVRVFVKGKEYLAGLMLLDLENPQKVIGLAPEPLLRATEKYELDGFRGSVIFPGGMILEESGEVKIYYGGADTVECLATASVDDLLGMIKPFRRS